MHKDDLCDLQELTEENILRCLTERYHQNNIFTNIGLTLLAINPYKQIEHLFSPQKLTLMKESISKGIANRQPHIYTLAGRAYQGMLNNQQKQAIIISGESGAGKTESAKYCLKMLTRFSQEDQSGLHHPVEQKLLACNPILQAFGNSKTVRNDNSSRFGKYLQIYFDAKQTIRGANVRSYLLQKTRVTHVAPGQRNFHIFYALCAANNINPKSYNFLNKSDCYTVNCISEKDSYLEIKRAMDELGFPKSEQQRFQKLLLTILQLGNLEFNDKEHKDNENLRCQITNLASLNKIASTFGVDSDALTQALVTNKLQIPKQIILKPLNKEQCEVNRNTLCKSIYNCLFQSIIAKINEALSPDRKFELSYRSSTCMYNKEPMSPSTFEINILDIFGFQNFAENSLEQLCINYTNQKLLNIYNISVFQNEIQQLREDDIDVESFTAPSSEPKIILLEEVFRIIRQRTIIKQFRDEDIISAFRTNRENSQHIRTIEYNRTRDNLFIIKHSPIDIAYSVTGFKAKNQDKVSEDIQIITTKVFPELRAQPQARTLLEKFTSDINILTNQLSAAQNHYVRCIKPNDQKRNLVEPEFMRRQIRYLGVFETIKIRKNIFPYRKTYAQFVQIYQQLIKRREGVCDRERVEALLKEVTEQSQKYVLGNKRVYISSEVQQALNLRVIERMKLKKTMANKIIKAYRKMTYRQKIRKTVQKVLHILKILKSWAKKAEDERKQLLFCGMTFIKQTAERIDNERTLVELLSRIDNSSIDDRQISRSNHELQKFQDWDPLDTICRLQSRRSKNNVLDQYQRNEENKHKEMKREMDQIRQQTQELQLKLITKETQQQQLKIQKTALQTKLQEQQSQLETANHNNRKYKLDLENSEKVIETLKEQIRNSQIQHQQQKDKNSALSKQLAQLKKQNQQINNNFQSQIANNTHIQEQHFTLQTKLKEIRALKVSLSQKEAKLAETEAQYSKLNNQLDTIRSRNQELQQDYIVKNKKEQQSTKRVKQLQQMVISLEKVKEQYKRQNNDLSKAKQEANSKLYQKIKALQDTKKKVNDLQHKQKLGDLSKDALERLKLKVNFLESEKAKLQKAIKELQFEVNQYRMVNQKLRDKVSEQQKITGSEIMTSTFHNQDMAQLSERDILKQLVSLKFSMNSNQLRILRAKIGQCLS